ncbi:uncharacterized protein [Aegilops tauschii subsp. strangulata]|uniref:Longin domain-containing protein n=1 Tax=Aegilops tauschii subsp. strangulata TaxID=200361 RepID=A0A453JMJ6_AEGTS|nr:synaptobrevin homolog YKT6-like [Aegilops tauschii subsp. strangulata]
MGLVVLKPSAGGTGGSSSSGGQGSEALLLANATDVSHFSFFRRGAAREFIVFVARTVAQRTLPGQRQSVQHEGSTSQWSDVRVHLAFLLKLESLLRQSYTAGLNHTVRRAWLCY